MSATFIKGDGSPRIIRAGNITIDKYGLATGTVVWWSYTYAAMLAANVTNLYSLHPKNPGLVCEKMTFTDSESGATLEANYAGLLYNIAAVPVDELDTTIMDVPIECHPDFILFAGTPDAPLHDARFLPKADPLNKPEFTRFGSDAGPAFRGVTSFEVATSISRRTTVSVVPPNASMVGRKQFPPNAFGITGVDWLCTGVSSQKRGNVYVTKQEWRASGRLGWNNAIYH